MCNFPIVKFGAIAYNIVAGRNTLYTHDIELTFKRYVISSIMRPPVRWLFYFVGKNGEYYEYLCLFR